MWSVGCILAEMLTGKPLFTSRSSFDQLLVIFRVMGTPDEETWPGVTGFKHYTQQLPMWKPVSLPNLFPACSVECVDLLGQLLSLDPAKRLSAKQALAHPFFNENN